MRPNTLRLASLLLPALLSLNAPALAQEALPRIGVGDVIDGNITYFYLRFAIFI